LEQPPGVNENWIKVISRISAEILMKLVKPCNFVIT